MYPRPNLPALLKRLFRQLSMDYLLQKQSIYTHDIYYIYNFLVKFYPDESELWDILIESIISEPGIAINNIKYIRENTNNFINKEKINYF